MTSENGETILMRASCVSWIQEMNSFWTKVTVLTPSFEAIRTKDFEKETFSKIFSLNSKSSFPDVDIIFD